MSRTSRLAGALALLGAFQGAGAQDTERLTSVLDTLIARQGAATARRQAYDDSVSRSRSTFDTITSGPLRMFAGPGERRVAETAARIAFDSLAPLGDSLLRRMDGLQFVIRGQGARGMPVLRWQARRPRLVAMTLLDHNGLEQGRVFEAASRPELLAAHMIGHARVRLAQGVPAELARWGGGSGGVAALRFDTALAFEWVQLRLDLVSSASLTARGCYAGRVADCRHVLGLDSSATPYRSYFDSAGRHALVRSNVEVYRRQDYPATEECLSGADRVCLELLEGGFAQAPIASIGHRVSLLQLAIQHGGPQATSRVFRGRGTVEQQLVAISGTTSDSLVGLWLSRIRNERVASDNMSAGMALASFGWIGLLGLLALRNKRWR